ncbi:MAG: hypothetical protein KAX84_21435 [Burkholderiales bacterium]|nr:hypothetical protein [Burkholderiales bacterium]
MSLVAVPIELSEANEFVANFHRHNKPVTGHRFSIGVSDGNNLRGVCIVGRPVSRIIQAQGYTAEVLRCCVQEGAPKGSCSFLYAAAWRAWRAMGGQRLITYTLQSEGGASLRGAGWSLAATKEANDPKRWQSRAGRAWQPVVGQAKFLWEAPT